MKKRILALAVLFALCLSLFSGCGDDTAGKVFRFDIFSEPSSLDPQTASSDDQQLILLNVMEGLMKKGADGAPVPAAAERYTVSKDKLTYTFTLRDDMLWSDGETPVTAYDFLFAFRRLLDPDTHSPTASDFLCIQGAENVLNGTTERRNLGVFAPDEKTVQFKLAWANPDFLSLLTTAGAMPCNEAYFTAARGKYGISYEYLLYNGPFYISSWREKDYIHMKKNGDYHGEDTVIPSAFRLYIQSEADLTRLTDGAVDAAAVSFSELKTLDPEEFSTVSFSNILWTILPNTDHEALANLSMRQALSAAVVRGDLSGYLQDNQRLARGLVPPVITLSGSSYRSLSDERTIGIETDYTPTQLYQIALKQLQYKEDPSLTLICPDTEGIPMMLSQLQKQWHETLGVFVNIEPLDLPTLQSRIAARDYDLALCPVKAAYDSPEAILTQLFGAGSLTGWEDSQLNLQMTQANRSATAAYSAASYLSAEKSLVQSGIAIPLYYETSYYVTAAEVSGLHFSPFGCHVFFSEGRK